MKKQVLSVTNVNTYIKHVMDNDYILKNLWVQGEISNYKAHSSGHLYFTLKDEGSSINCVMFRTYVQSLNAPIRDGMKVLVQGSVSVYERSGVYQIYVKVITDEGAGRLYQEFEALKTKLGNEGLFAEEKKKKIPNYAQTIGIITSDTGAAIRDIVEVSRRRNPYVRLRLYPSLVQGQDAASSLCKALEYFNQEPDKVDIIIIGRGGGSIEDLWPFNEERLARAIAGSTIPVISGVGHETDFTIADFVSDLRAPTPSAAAELAVFDLASFDYKLSTYRDRLNTLLKKKIDFETSRLNFITMRLNHLSPIVKYERLYQYIAELQDRLSEQVKKQVLKKKNQLEVLNASLLGHSPYKRLDSGFGYITHKDRQKITSVTQVSKGDQLIISLRDGQILANVETTRKGHDYE